jgi:hypothetical protein
MSLFGSDLLQFILDTIALLLQREIPTLSRQAAQAN